MFNISIAPTADPAVCVRATHSENCASSGERQSTTLMMGNKKIEEVSILTLASFASPQIPFTSASVPSVSVGGLDGDL